MKLSLLDEPLAACRLPAGERVPSWALELHHAFVSLTRTRDELSIVCKAAGFERSLYLTFAVLILDRDANAMGRAREYGELYEELPREAAQRTIRFWRMRRQTGDVAAA